MTSSKSLFRAAALLPILFLPTVRAFAAPPQVDPSAIALLQKSQAAMQKLHSLSADCLTVTRSPKTESREGGTIHLLKPNYGREQIWDMAKDPLSGVWKKKSQTRLLVSDGKSNWITTGSGCIQSADDPHGSSVSANTLSMDFFNTSHSLGAMLQGRQFKDTTVSLMKAGTEQWNGQPCQVIEWTRNTNLEHPAKERRSAPGGVIAEKDRLYFNPALVLCRVTMTDNIGGSGEYTLTNIKINTALMAANFKFMPPPGTQLSNPYAAPPTPKPLLANGTAAPDFTATAPDGSLVRLSDYKGKVVVLDFWSTWCGPCQRSMPHLEKVYQEVKDKNVAVLGGCVWDEKAAYDTWVTAKKDTYHFPTAFDPAGRGKTSIASGLYHVSGIPTQYVIGKDGKIAASTVGYDEGGTELETALSKLGATVPVPTASKP